jgi:hypothetical protein
MILLSCSKKEETIISNNVIEGVSKELIETIDYNLLEMSQKRTSDESGIVTIDYNNLLKGMHHLDYNYTAEDYKRNGAIGNIIESGGKLWTIRHLVGTLSLQGWKEDIVDILDNPRGNVIYRIVKKPRPAYDFVFLLAITKEMDTVDGIEFEGILYEDHWVKILIDYDKSGWIFGSKLDVERGGPKYLTPENVEPYILEGSDEFERYYVKENVVY